MYVESGDRAVLTPRSDMRAEDPEALAFQLAALCACYMNNADNPTVAVMEVVAVLETVKLEAYRKVAAQVFDRQQAETRSWLWASVRNWFDRRRGEVA